MNNPRWATWPFEYKWLVAFIGLLVLFTALGLGRFGLGMLLPSMRTTLVLSYAQMGFIGTGNFIGYFAAVFLCRYVVSRYGSRSVISLALLVLGLSMILIGRAEGFVQVMVLYCLTGLASGFANVPMMGLVTPWFPPAQRGRAAGIMSMGNGFAIMFSGLLIPYVNHQLGAEGWRTSWLVFGVIGVVIAGVCLGLLREHPQAVGSGAAPGDADATGKSKPVVTENSERTAVLKLGGAYFVFGFTYAIYVTFIVTTLVQERGFSEAVAGNFWFWVGFLSLLSGPVFGGFSDWLGRKAGLMLVFALQGMAYVLVAGSLSHYALYLSIGLFGVCAWSIPAIMAAAAGDYVGPQRAVAAFSTVTLFFSVGQIMGPALAGMLAEQSGGFASSYWMSGILAALAILLTVTLRRPRLSATPT